MNTQILEEASEWLVELQTDDTDAHTRERFQAWLEKSPEHIRAYLEVTAVWEDSSHLDTARSLDVDALIAAAKTEGNVYPFERNGAAFDANAAAGEQNASSGQHGVAAADVAAGVGVAAYTRASTLRSWRRRPAALAASIAVLAVVLTAAWYGFTYERSIYATTIGQQRTFALSDGTTVELNANSTIRERFTDTRRAVELVQGQALFRVVKDPTRPFIVTSDTATVRAVGTQFDVHKRATRTTVTVLEGRVAIASAAVGDDLPAARRLRAAGSSESNENVATVATAENPSLPAARRSRDSQLFLNAGEQATIGTLSGSIVQASNADVNVATAWTRQNLIFQSASLGDAAEEFNRFSPKKLIVHPEGLDDFRISGTFPALDPQSLPRFVRFLREQPGISIVEDGDRIVVSKNR